MQQKIVTFLWFDGNAEDAVRHYMGIFKNSRKLAVSHWGDVGPPGTKGSVLTVMFELEGQQYVALNGGPEFKFNEAVSFFISVETQDEVDYFWTRLTADGGEESQCGWLKDKFGLSWQVVPTILGRRLSDPDRQKANRAMQAMLKMRKIVIADIETAFSG